MSNTKICFIFFALKILNLSKPDKHVTRILFNTQVIHLTPDLEESRLFGVHVVQGDVDLVRHLVHEHGVSVWECAPSHILPTDSHMETCTHTGHKFKQKPTYQPLFFRVGYRKPTYVVWGQTNDRVAMQLTLIYLPSNFIYRGTSNIMKLVTLYSGVTLEIRALQSTFLVQTWNTHLKFVLS